MEVNSEKQDKTNPSYNSLIKSLCSEFGDNLKTIVLFGSRARKQARDDSDHDILIIIEDLPLKPWSILEDTSSPRWAYAPQTLADVDIPINVFFSGLA
ncbi:MAG: nucleotidyltransferase domain-containing protein [Acidobacteriota bacterium]|nr:nucleotidyltransferase domain-containing protein [Acidobacteriota bacterium]